MYSIPSLVSSAPQRRGGGFVPRHNLPLARRPSAYELDRIQLAGQRCPPMTWRGCDVGSPTSHRERRWESHATSAAHVTQVLVAFHNNVRNFMDTAPTQTLLVFESHRLQEPPENGAGNCRKVLDVVLGRLWNRRHSRIFLGLAQKEVANFPAHRALLQNVTECDSLPDPSTEPLSWRVFRR